MKTVQIGIGTEYANLSSDPDFITDPVIAINSGGTVLSVYGDQFNNLYYNIGGINGVVIDWNGSKDYVSGAYSAIAINDSAQFVEVHRTSNVFGSSLWWYAGSIDTIHSTLSHGDGYKEDSLYGGSTPSIALSNVSVVAAAFQIDSTHFKCKVGKVNTSSKKIDWCNNATFTGISPTIAFNESGGLIVVFIDSNRNMAYKKGQLINNNTNISWGDTATVPGAAYGSYMINTKLSVAYTNDTFVIAYSDMVYDSDTKTSYQALKSVSCYFDPTTGSYEWEAPVVFDYGTNACISANENCLVQVHKSENLQDIYYSMCYITDHARWMENLMPTIQNLKLGQIVMPATHDAGIYVDDVIVESRTQDMNILGQLKGGVRYFDLRPQYESSTKDYYTYHGPSKGSAMTDILTDVKTFMHDYQSKEFVILKFSHFDNFGSDSNTTNTIYTDFIQLIVDNIGVYLCTQSSDTKFGDYTFGNLVENGGRVLVVCSDNYARNYPRADIFVYRDGSLACPAEARTNNPTEGNLVVWDCYTNTTTSSTMESDQLNKLTNYTGFCDGSYSTVPCDMFLLSWTLTPYVKSVWYDSENPARDLGASMNNIGLNSYNKIPNLLYVNFFEFTRATDIAIMMNQKLGPLLSLL